MDFITELQIPYKLNKKIIDGGYGEIYTTIIDKQTLIVKKIKNAKYFNYEYTLSINIKPFSKLCKCINKFNTAYHTYLLFPYYKKGDLQKYLCNNKLDENSVKKYVFQMLKAVKELNNMGYIHGDIKLENFLLTDDGDLVLADFGSIRVVNKDSDKLLPLDRMIGSNRYISPESLLYYYNDKSDIWSIGVCFYNMLLCENLYENVTKYQYDTCILDINKLSIDRNILSYKGQYLLRRMLQISPLRRISIDNALEDKWFDDIKEKLPVIYISLNELVI